MNSNGIDEAGAMATEFQTSLIFFLLSFMNLRIQQLFG